MAKEVTIDHVIRLPQVQFNTSFLPTRSAESPHHLMSQEAMFCNRPPLDERSLVRGNQAMHDSLHPPAHKMRNYLVKIITTSNRSEISQSSSTLLLRHQGQESVIQLLQ
ncbi:Uncharacterized protein M6B38_216860 [Iris pallida]|uniref:Uncharacterized protein n=1 Tax=Iris pallida TaxID=29817 RepID=A0AAX6E029_IRIPA|nr:Uncharacterized protein M6B38_216860 [Iris pallida]